MIPHIIPKDLKLVSCFGARPRVNNVRRRTSIKRPSAVARLSLSPFNRRRFISKLSVSSSAEASTSLATYNLEFRRSHSLFESFLVELIKHLDEAPVLQSIMVSDQITFHYTKNLPNDDYQDQLHKDSDVFMYCKAISKDPVPGGRKYLTGSIGDCCEESLESSKEADQDSQFWGLVVKSSLFPRMEGCYLLRTSRVSAGAAKHDCLCTHYSLTKISAGVPLADQYDASWLA